MEKIVITENSIKISLFISNNKLFYIDHNNSNVNINKYLDLLKFDEEYFNNNGEYCVYYKNGSNKKTDTKKFRFKNIVIITGLSAILLLNSVLLLNDSRIINIPLSYAYEDSVSLTLNDIKDMIYSSPYLTDEEKDYIYNEDYFTDILPFINLSSYNLHEYRTHLTGIKIISYGSEYEHYDRDEGYYRTSTPNTLYIKNYSEFNDDKKDTIAHEFIHLCQDTSGYNLIIEACAEIISNEYYEKTPVEAYSDQVILIKKLMEIIGPEVIWNYNFTGNFSPIEDEIKPYLSREDYKLFLNCLTFDYNNPDQEKFKLLEELIGRLYTAKYNKDIKDDEVIKCINHLNRSLVRNYFNNRQTESYYIDYNDVVVQTIDLQTAMDYGVVNIYATKKIPVSYEEIKDIELPPNTSIKREISSHHENVILTGSPNGQGNAFINCFVDGVRFHARSIDELFENHLLKVDYYLVERIPLNAEEYISGIIPEGYEIEMFNSESTVINDDFTVTAKIPNKIILPLIKNESYHL